MGVLDDTRVRALLAGFVLSLFALVVTTTLGLVAALSALGGASPTAPLPFVLLGAAAPYLVASALVGVVSFALFVALAVATLRRASLPRNERLADLARNVERVSSEAREADLAARFEPTTEDRIEDLKERYVEGEISEWEYERRLQELLTDERGDDGYATDDRASDERVRRERDPLERELSETGSAEREREFER